jgi:hypothetical protein
MQYPHIHIKILSMLTRKTLKQTTATSFVIYYIRLIQCFNTRQYVVAVGRSSEISVVRLG